MATQSRRYIPGSGTFGGGGMGYATTKDLFEGVSQQNEADDNQRYFAADRARRTNANPAIRQMKARILANAGYTADEVENMVDDPKVWRPEYARLGLQRPYSLDVNYGGNTSSIRQGIVDKKLDDDFQIKRRRALDGLALDEEIFNREAPLRRAEMQEEVEQERRISPQRFQSDRGGSTAKTPKRGESPVAMINRESILSGGAPVIRRPVTPQMSFVGQRLSTSLRDARGGASSLNDLLKSAQVELDSANVAYGVAKQSGIEARLRPAAEGLNAAKRKVQDIENRLGEAEDQYGEIADRATKYGLETAGDKLIDPETGSVFEPRVYGPQQMPQRATGRRLNPVQRARMQPELNRIYGAGIGDEEEDNITRNPNGVLAKFKQQVLRGGGYLTTPTSDDQGRLVLKPRLSVGAKTGIGVNLLNEASAITEQNPELSEDDALYIAAQRRKGLKPDIYQFPQTRTATAPSNPSNNDWEYGSGNF